MQLILFILIISFSFFQCCFSQAEKISSVDSIPSLTNKKESEPILLDADEVSYNEVLGISTARGNVRLSSRNNVGALTILQADTVTFNEKSNLATATGNVQLFSPQGDVYKASYVELTNDLKEGFIKSVYLLTKNNYRFAARRAIKKEDGSVTDLEDAVYSPCNLCESNPRKAPLWQLKARNVRQDQKEMNIYYDDAWMEIEGIPIFYTPYLSHPDPSVIRRSGLLAPIFGYSSDLGIMGGIPYYQVINNSQDLTITPLIISKDTPILSAEYRQQFLKGKWVTSGSITQSKSIGGTSSQSVNKPTRVRGHIHTKASFDLSDTWRSGIEVNRATDPTYVRRYRFQDVTSPQTNTLDSKIFAEGFYGRSYALIRGYAFQPTQINVSQRQEPYVLPLASYNYVGHQREYGDYFFGNSSVAVITREQGTDMRRTSLEGGWEIPYYGSIGDIYTLTTTLRGDAYNVDNYKQTSTSSAVQGTTGRLFPQIGLNWRYPLSSTSSFVPLLVEPMLGFVAAPQSGNFKFIPNEDSTLELDETNLFKLDRFSGLDRVDGGQRFNYGMTVEAYPLAKRFGTFFLGQSYSFNKNKAIPTGLGVQKGFSDVVGSTVFTPYTNTKIKARVLWDNSNFRAKRNQVGFEVGPPIFRITGNYLYIASNATDTSFNGKEQVIGGLSSQISPFWRIVFDGSRNLGRQGGNLAQSIGAIYEDECFIFKSTLIRTFYQDRDIRPDNIVLFSFGFKTLGEISTGNLKLDSQQRDRQDKLQSLLGK